VDHSESKIFPIKLCRGVKDTRKVPEMGEKTIDPHDWWNGMFGESTTIHSHITRKSISNSRNRLSHKGKYFLKETEVSLVLRQFPLSSANLLFGRRNAS
jgi:hypothetical protein